MSGPLPFFVYGTLRPGRGNYRIIEQAVVRVRPALLPGYRLYDHDLPYAGVPIGLQDGACDLRGDLLYMVPGTEEAALEVLDGLEGYEPPYTAGYVRCALGVRALDGKGPQRVTAWVYLGGALFTYSRQYLVPSGDFLQTRKAPQAPKPSKRRNIRKETPDAAAVPVQRAGGNGQGQGPDPR